MYRLRITGNLGFEFWQDIPEYEGLYQASTYGRVRSVERIVVFKDGRKKTFPPVLLKYGKRRDYLKVDLCKNGKVVSISVHRLIAITFLPNFENLAYINHKSEVKTENQIWNLEYCTNSYNLNYGTAKYRISEKQKNDKKKSKPVFQYNLDGTILKRFPSIMEAERQTGFFHTHINACCLGKRKTAYGFKWSYAAKS